MTIPSQGPLAAERKPGLPTGLHFLQAPRHLFLTALLRNRKPPTLVKVAFPLALRQVLLSAAL